MIQKTKVPKLFWRRALNEAKARDSVHHCFKLIERYNGYRSLCGRQRLNHMFHLGVRRPKDVDDRCSVCDSREAKLNPRRRLS